MSFIGANDNGQVYAPGYFLAHEECERVTAQFSQSGATNVNGRLYHKAGEFYPDNTNANVVGIVYEDVDVTSGNMPGSVVKKGTIYQDRLPVNAENGVINALVEQGFTFTNSPAVNRPYTNVLNNG